MSLEDAIETVAPSGFSLDRDRPYDGQPHTFMGIRGGQLVVGLSIRDIIDAFTLACFESSGLSQEDWPDSIFKLPFDDMDPVAIGQNLGCNIERLMGIFPNIPERETNG